jgi:hypothetical protein
MMRAEQQLANTRVKKKQLQQFVFKPYHQKSQHPT